MMAGSGVVAGPTWDQWVASSPASFSTLTQLGERFCRSKSSCAGQQHFSLIRAPCCVAQCLHDVLAFQIRIVGKKLIDADAGADLANDHADCNPHSPDAGMAAHHIRALRDAVQIRHGGLLLETHCPEEV